MSDSFFRGNHGNHRPFLLSTCFKKGNTGAGALRVCSRPPPAEKLLAAGLIRAQFMAQWPKLPSGYVKIAIENGHL